MQSSRVEQESRYVHLLRKFELIDVDTLHVFSESGYGKFKGIKLDSSASMLLPIDTRDMDYVMDYGVYACFRFDIDSNHVGLIARTPSIYESSSIDLFIWDKEKDKITYSFQLAQSVGDAGVASLKTSWLMKKGEERFTTFIYDHESEQDFEDTIGSSYRSWEFYYQLDWKQNKLDFDTVSTDERKLSSRYHKFLTAFNRND